MSRRRALFLDRDGVINVDHGYVHERARFQFMDGIFELVRWAVVRGFLVVVVTNQSGIGRGYYSEQDFLTLMQWMTGEFESRGGRIERVYFCPDHPVHGIGAYKRDSDLRKPQPGMILAAARELAIDLDHSVLVGDNDTDIAAGLAAGVGCNILLRPEGDPVGHEGNHIVVTSLKEVASYLDECKEA